MILNDITDTVGSVFLGLTYGCARCHDHKFDPILHRDYYRLQAFFANVRTEDRAMLVPEDQERAYQEQYAAWEAKTQPARSKMDQLVEPIREQRIKEGLARFPEEVREACLMAPEKRNPYQRMMYLMAKPQLDFDGTLLARRLKGEQAKQFAELAGELKKYDPLKPAQPPVAQTIVDAGRESPKTYVLAVGNWEAPGEEVQPGFLSILDPRPANIVPPENLNSTGRRTALANWLTDPRNPLTARVMVNRIWQHHFGRGIVAHSKRLRRHGRTADESGATRLPCGHLRGGRMEHQEDAPLRSCSRAPTRSRRAISRRPRPRIRTTSCSGATIATGWKVRRSAIRCCS